MNYEQCDTCNYNEVCRYATEMKRIEESLSKLNTNTEIFNTTVQCKKYNKQHQRQDGFHTK